MMTAESLDPQISAYIPCYNNAPTIARTIESIRSQTRPASELFVIDDGSTDDSAAIARDLGVRVISHPQNLGRGAARYHAMLEAKYELVLCCDGTKILELHFIENALHWFQKENVAGVFGTLIQASNKTVSERWRARHLFACFSSYSDLKGTCLPTFGAIVRRETILKAGNYDRQLRQNEDGELGKRLLSLGYEIISDSRLTTIEIGRNSIHQVLERYRRWKSWNAGKGEKDLNWKTYCEWIVESINCLVLQDVRSGDWSSVPISLYCPHYRFWKSWWHKVKGEI